jgi:hypothetical protein
MVWAALPALVASLALTRPGFPTQAVELGDSSVWVTNLAGGQPKVARYNAPIEELTGGFTLTAGQGDFDVAQSGQDVAVTGTTAFRLVDPAAMKLGEPVTYPPSESVPGLARMAVGGAAAVVVGADGARAWLRPITPVSHLDLAADPPDLDFSGATGGLGGETGPAVDAESKTDFSADRAACADSCGSRIVMAPDGKVFAVAPDGRIIQLWLEGRDPGGQSPSERVRTRDLGRVDWPAVAGSASVEPSDGISAVTALGDHVYALSGTILAWDGGAVDLGAYGPADSLKLQTPAANAAGQPPAGVVVATAEALLLIGPRGQVTEWKTGNRGQPATPTAAGDCVHAAWAAGPERGDNYIASCGGAKTASRALEGLGEGARVVFRVNRLTVVLNDVQDGRLWMPLQDDQVRAVLNWDQIDPKPLQAEEPAAAAVRDRESDCGDQAGELAAREDEFGVRPGTSAVLTVLGNDSASGCEALGIERIDGLDPASGRAEPVLAGRAIQFTPAPGLTSARFTYTVSDLGGQTDTAAVVVTVSDTANRPPAVPAQPLRLAMELGAQATYRALEDFIDPDGDPLVLAGAATDDPDLRVSWHPDGAVTVMSANGSPRTAAVRLAVTDGLGAAASPATLNVELVEPGTLVPAADAVKADTAVGQTVTLDLRQALRTGHLAAPVFALDGQGDPLTEAKLDPSTGQLSFTASVANTYSLAVTISTGVHAGAEVGADTGADAGVGAQANAAAGVEAGGGAATSSGAGGGKDAGAGRMVARIDVAEVGEPALVAVLDTVYVRPGQPTVIDPLANDGIGAREVALLRDFRLPESPGLSAVPLGHQHLEIADNGGQGSEDIGYTVTAGGVTANGVIRVVHAAAGPGQDPVVTPQTLTVRAGGVVTIPVLEHSFDPDGDTLSIAAAMIEPSPPCGKVYASGRSVRYQAPPTPCPEPVTVAVPVVDDAGGSALGRFTVAVHRSNAAKAPPQPLDLTARVFQGQEVTIAVPLTGIDVDGDGVSLLQGLDIYPQNGTITEIGPDYIKYRAGQDQSPGSEVFVYAVEDWAANRATASVTVGVAAPGDGAFGVVARDDKATARPGKVLEVPVLANDVDLAGQTAPEFCADEPPSWSSDLLRAQTDPATGRLIVLLPPEPGQYQVVYHACGRGGDHDSASLNLTVDPAAPVVPPQAKDIVSPPQATIDKASVDIDVLRTAYNPSGLVSDLELFLPQDAGGQAVLKNASEVTVTLQDDLPTIVFYGLRNTDAEARGATAYGSITVPPISRPPYLRPDVAPIRVPAGGETVIDLDVFVAVARGRVGAFLFDPSGGADGSGGSGRPDVEDGTGGGSGPSAGDSTGGVDQKAGAAAGGSSTGGASTGGASTGGGQSLSGDAGGGLTARHGRAVAANAGRGIGYAPDRDHAGPDRIEFWVADTADSADPLLKKSKLWLDVLVTPDSDSRLSFQDPTPQVERGGSRTIDLADFVRVDGAPPGDPGLIRVGPLDTSASGLEVRRSGTAVTIEAGLEATVGDRAAIALTLAYGGGAAQTGFRLSVAVIETKLPAVKPNAPAQVKVARGQAQAVPVLAGVFDPWANQEPARLEAVVATGEVGASVSGQSITVTAPAAQGGAATGSATGGNATSGNAAAAVSFVVVDAAGRRQTGRFPVVVRDKPAAPGAVTAVPGNRGEALVSWAPVVGPAAGGEPVQSYRVTLAGADCEEAPADRLSSRCRMNSLAYGVRYRVEVRARNAIGESDRPGVGVLDYDTTPDPPLAGQAVAGKNRIDLNWSPPPVPTGAVDHYTVTCNGAVVGATVRTTRLTVTGLGAGVTQSCSVQAVGRKGASAGAAFEPCTPYGELDQPAPPTVSWADEESVNVAWEEVANAGVPVAYTLVANGSPVGGCTATPCAVALAPGEVATFAVRVASEQADIGAKTSSPAGPLRQGPAALEPLPEPVLAVEAAAGSDEPGGLVGAADQTSPPWVGVVWPEQPVRPGFDVVAEWYFDGQRLSSALTRFGGLTAGVHTAQVVYCLASHGSVPLVSGFPAGRLCAQSPQARIEVAPAAVGGAAPGLQGLTAIMAGRSDVDSSAGPGVPGMVWLGPGAAWTAVTRAGATTIRQTAARAAAWLAAVTAAAQIAARAAVTITARTSARAVAGAAAKLRFETEDEDEHGASNR